MVLIMGSLVETTSVNQACRIALWSRSDFDSANQMIWIKDNIKLYFYTITDNIAVYTN